MLHTLLGEVAVPDRGCAFISSVMTVKRRPASSLCKPWRRRRVVSCSSSAAGIPQAGTPELQVRDEFDATTGLTCCMCGRGRAPPLSNRKLRRCTSRCGVGPL